VTEDAQAGPEPFAFDEDDLVDAGPRPGLGLVLAAVLAIGASAGLAWWVAAPDRTADVATAPPPEAATPLAAAPAPPPLRYAAADPDPGAVRRAWGDVREAYVDGGPEALVRASQGCAKALPSDPQRLDYCLAYDLYASAIVAGHAGDWFADSTARDLALARTALPDGVDPTNRIEQVAALTTAVLPKPKAQKPKAKVLKAKVAKSVRHAPARAKSVKVRHRPVAAKPKLVHASAPAPRSDPATDLDAWLARAQSDDLLEPPH